MSSQLAAARTARAGMGSVSSQLAAAARPAQDRRPVAIDLYAGTGGATAAFRDAGWAVVRIDLLRPRRQDGLAAGQVVADVRALPLAGAVDFLWASPPCTEFSDANPNRPARPSLELVHAAMIAVRDLRPRFWIIENVRGAIPFLGIPAQKVGPWCLWGYFPPIDVTYDMQLHRKSSYHTAAARAAVPYALSVAVLRAVELHAGIGSLLDMRPFRRHRHVAARSAGGRGQEELL